MLFNIKKAFLIILFLFFQISAFSVEVEKNGHPYVLVNSKDFSITQKITSQPLVLVTNATLIVGDKSYINEINQEVKDGNELSYTYGFDTFEVDKNSITDEMSIYFSIKVIDPNPSPEGDYYDAEIEGATSYYIEIDNVSPNLIENETNIDDIDHEITLEFDKPIYIMEIYDLNEEKIYRYEANPNQYDEYTKIYKFTLDNLSTDSNNFKIEYYDFYGNSNEEDLKINVKGSEPLSIDLLTYKDDDSLKYYFYEGNDPILKEFYNDTLYVMEGNNNFYLSFQTNKEADCIYYKGETKKDYNDAGGLTSHQKVPSDDDKKNFEFEIPSGQENFNIVCKDSFENEKYLTDYGNLDYVPIHYVESGDFKIEDISPKGTVKTQSFNIEVETNKESICIENEIIYNSNDKRFHKQSYVKNNNQKYTFDISCYDKLNQEDSVSHNLFVDYDSSIKILNFQPIYTDNKTTKVSFEISDPNEDCYIGNSDNNLRISDKKTQKDGDYKRIGEITLHNEGSENKVYIQCGAETGNIYEKTILYEVNGPQINNVLVNGEIYSSDKYLQKYEINIELNSTYLIDLDRYDVELFYNSSYSKTEEKNKDKFKLSGLEGVKSITFQGVNVIDNEGNEKTIRLNFDTIKPNITIKKPIITDLKIETSDEDSGIDDSTIKYGFSSSQSLCYPNKAYLKNILASVPPTALYVCAEVYDKAGNKNSVIEQVREEVPVIDEEIEEKTDEDNSADESWEDGIREDIEVETEDPILNEGDDTGSSSDEDEPLSIEKPEGLEDNESGSGLLITMIVVFLIMSIFGTTFFLWYKGKFDDFIYKNLISNPKFENIGRKLIRRDLTNEQNINSHIRNITHKPTQYMSKTYKTNSTSKSKPNNQNEISSQNKTFTPIKGIFDNRFSKEKGIFDKFSDDKAKDLLRKDVKEEQKDFEDFYKSKKDSK